MKFIFSFFGLAWLAMLPVNGLAAGNNMGAPMQHNGMQHGRMHESADNRTSLNLSPEMKQHQLANMRSHLEAVQTIVGLLAKRDFEQAAQIAHTKLGLTDEMKKMCSMFGNQKFEQLGLAFHKSGDELGNTLSTKNLDKSLQALSTTINYCVQCHAIFRQ